MRIVDGAGEYTKPVSGVHWLEHFRSADLSVGTYSVPAGGTDTQVPHTEDEIYVITSGRARLVTTDGEAEAGPGMVFFVPAGEEHRFVDIAEDFAALVIFGPAEYSRAGVGAGRT